MTTVPEVPGDWLKSSRSAQETDCVEVKWRGAVRDSKNPDGGQLVLPIAGLIAAAKDDNLLTR